MPEGVPPDTELSVAVDGNRVARRPPRAKLGSTARSRCVAVSARISRYATGATINLKRSGLGEDERDLGFHLDDIVFEP